MNASPSPRRRRPCRWSVALVILAGAGLELGAADREDYLHPPAARWGRLLLTNTEPAVLIATPSGYAVAGLTEQVVTGRAGFLATFNLEGELLHWAAYPHEPMLLAGFSVGDLALTRDAAGTPDGYVMVGSVPKDYEDGGISVTAAAAWEPSSGTRIGRRAAIGSASR